jgi:translation initiation factor 1
MAQDKLVYSTAQASTRKTQSASQGKTPATGPTKMRLETKGRGGKAVTVLWNFPFADDEIKSLVKALQQKAACGATLKDGRAEFQGDIRDKALAYFKAQGWSLIPAGG